MPSDSFRPDVRDILDAAYFAYDGDMDSNDLLVTPAIYEEYENSITMEQRFIETDIVSGSSFLMYRGVRVRMDPHFRGYAARWRPRNARTGDISLDPPPQAPSLVEQVLAEDNWDDEDESPQPNDQVDNSSYEPITWRAWRGV